MAKVKICGLKRLEDMEYVNKYLPEYVGFVFASSRRQVSPDMARILTAMLDNRIKAVGVFVNGGIPELVEAACRCRLGVLQVHGNENPEYIESLKAELHFQGLDKVKIWKAFRMKNNDSFKAMDDYEVDAVILDTFSDGSYGGSGMTFDWSLTSRFSRKNKIILAGGLDISNVQEAIRIVQPFAVDVSSGVETDGYKDEKKIRDFICMARSYE